MKNLEKYLNFTIMLSKKAARLGEVPVGAVIVERRSGKIISSAHNLCETNKNPLDHAEIIAINKAINKIGQKYLYDYDIYISLEPCILCCAAISKVRLKNIIFSSYDHKLGAAISVSKFFTSKLSFHKPNIFSGILSENYINIIKEFFKQLR